jgi:two-component system chemotaxis response regulator CheY
MEQPRRAVRVLVVDDVPAMRMILRNMLLGIGFTSIEEADDGEAAWKAILDGLERTDPIGLVIADWNMARMSGIELLRAVRASPRTRGVPFFLVTAEGSPAHQGEASRAEVTDYLVKPFNAEQLAEKLMRHLLVPLRN